ncbi:MAG TPA: Crp/Fnr family transcriptional regulator [Actinomycetota bacterium]|nr:Crp/Fnr family transcriptional regulator [Actinomycetota bacterium]
MQGDPSLEVFVLLEGRLEIATTSPSSGAKLQGRLAPVRLFGEIGVFAETERTASVLCLEDARIWVLERDPFISLVSEEPSLAIGLLRAFARLAIAKETSADDLVWLHLKGRLAKRLLQLANDDGADGVRAVPPISQADLASLCGVSRESVSKTLATFSRRGIVRRDGRRYLLLDPDALEHLAQG